jgi:hypothetical protein
MTCSTNDRMKDFKAHGKKSKAEKNVASANAIPI